MGAKSGKYALRKDQLPEKEEESDSSLPTFIRQKSFGRVSPSTARRNTSVVWLDAELDNELSHVDTQIKLKNAIGYLRTFNDIDECEQYIEQIGQMNQARPAAEEKLLVIVSPEFALTLLPRIHDCSQVQSVYIYSVGKSFIGVIERARYRYSKVRIPSKQSRHLRTKRIY